MRCLRHSIAAVLALILLFCTVVPAFAGLGGDYSAPVPTVYLMGQGFPIYADKNDPRSEQIQDVEMPDGYIGDRAKEMIGPLADGIFRDRWDTWCDMLTDTVAELYAKQALDENGEASNGSGVNFSSGRYVRRNADGSYPLNAYAPSYDWRLDPCVIAEDLNTYIKQVKAATGCAKVNLIGRSIGANVLLAYFVKYGMDDLDNAVLYCPSSYGMEVFSRAFAGKIKVDAEAVERFASYYAQTGNTDPNEGESYLGMMPVLLKFVQASVRLNLLDLPVGALNRIYMKVYERVYPQLLVKMYGSMPSFWSLVGDEDYIQAKKLIFGENKETYAGLIQKIDRFHYDVLVPAAEIIGNLRQEGGKLHIVCKSGVPMVPVVEDAKENSDMLTTVRSATLGATTAPMGEKLPASYLIEASRKGAWKYFSPARDIDASTGILPDHTWFIEGLDHRSMPESVNVLFEAMLNYDGYMTVFNDPSFPQYMRYDADLDVVVPQPSVQQPVEEEPAKPSFFTRIADFFRRIVTFLRGLLRFN